MFERRRRRPDLIVAIVLLVLSALLAPAASGAAKRHRKPTLTQDVRSASTLVRRISKSRWAKGRRTVVVRHVTFALTDLKRKRICRALAQGELFRSGLRDPSTWKHRKPPATALRKPLRLLATANAGLLKKAGKRCARPRKATKKLKARKGGKGFRALKPPNEHPEQGEDEGKRLKQGTIHKPKSIGRTSGLGLDPHGTAFGRVGPPLARAADDGPLTFFRTSDVGAPSRLASPQEPTTAEGENVVWYTGNSSVALSTNAGRTFTTFNPSNILPDSGLPFCCDQLVSYAPSQHLFVWVIQYWCGTGSTSPATADCRKAGTASNRIRIAVASPTALRNNAANPGAAWTYWDISPQTFGLPAGAWFDRSDLGVGSTYMNWAVDTLRAGTASVLARVSLSDLAHRGSISIGYITDTPQRMTAAQGPGGATTFVGANSLSQERIWSWAPYSGTLFRHDINHSTVPIFDNAVTGTDSGNWYDRYGIFPGSIEGSTVSGNTLYVAQGTGRAYCTANCSGGSPTLSHVFDRPAVFVSRYDVNTWHLLGERWLWNPSYAFGFPTLATDGAGDVGIALRGATPGQNAVPIAGFLTPGEQFTVALPYGKPHETGDYYSLRPGRTSRSFVTSGQTVQADSGVDRMHWNYIEYGHGASPYVSPPSVSILSPQNLAQFSTGTSVLYSASVSDPVDGALPAAAIVWREDGAVIGTGTAFSHVENTAGLHTITLTATNGDGKSASASRQIRIQAPPEPGAPVVHITQPGDGAGFCTISSDDGGAYYPVQFTAAASDPNAPPQPLTYSWTDSVDGGVAGQVSTELSPLLRLHLVDQTTTTHDLTFTASNGAKSTSVSERINISAPIACLG